MLREVLRPTRRPIVAFGALVLISVALALGVLRCTVELWP